MRETSTRNGERDAPRRRRSSGGATRRGSGGASERAPLRPGVMLFGRYRLERQLGRGGMADVWEAHDDRLDRAVGVKVLRVDRLPDDRSRERFLAEAQAASGLADPGIVPVYDVIDDPRTPAIVFQLVPGESLASRLARDGSVPVDDATRIAAEVARALDHAHRAGIVHRDVKPANIVLGADGRARLVDFGIARVLDDTDGGPEREVAGTLRYMAPEQRAGDPGDARTDLYGLGRVIAEMLPGLAGAPGWLAALVDRLTAADPADRPGSAADVARALETGRLGSDGGAAADRDPVPAGAVAADPDAETRVFGAVAEAPVASADAIAAGEAIAPRARRVRNGRGIVAGVVATGLLVGAFVLGRGGLFGTAARGATDAPATVSPAATATPTPAPSSAPAPIPPAPRPHKPHKPRGHGRRARKDP